MKSLPLVSLRKSESGFMAAEWVGAVTLLMIPMFVFVFSFLQYPSRKNLTQAASTAAARAYVQALDQSQADAAASAAVVDTIVAEYGEPRRVEITGLIGSKIKYSVSESNGYCPGSEVTVRVEIPMPIAVNPFDNDNSLFPSGTKLSSSSTERIDDYSELADSETGTAGYPYDIENDPCG